VADRRRDALPQRIAHHRRGNLAYNANYWLSFLGDSDATCSNQTTIDQNGNPSIFANTSAANSFADELPGHSGTRAAIRLAPFFNTDLTFKKRSGF
jgi:hypothetical protein